MYTEVKELVNFIARYLFGRQPRRPTSIFAAELGNFLINSFSSDWDVNNPQNKEERRMLHIKCGNNTSNIILIAAELSGLHVEEVLSLLPNNVKIYTNPGDVYMKASDNGCKIPIWEGNVYADNDYKPFPEHTLNTTEERCNTNLGAAGKPILIGRQPFPYRDRGVCELVNSYYVPLELEEDDETETNLDTPHPYNYRFVYKPNSSQTFTGSQFAQTRFGSIRARTDLQTMEHMRRKYAESMKNQLGTTQEDVTSTNALVEDSCPSTLGFEGSSSSAFEGSSSSGFEGPSSSAFEGPSTSVFECPSNSDFEGPSSSAFESSSSLAFEGPSTSACNF